MEEAGRKHEMTSSLVVRGQENVTDYFWLTALDLHSTPRKPSNVPGRLILLGNLEQAVNHSSRSLTIPRGCPLIVPSIPFVGGRDLFSNL